MRSRPARAAAVLAVACLFVTLPAVAACPFVPLPIRCTTLDKPLSADVAGPAPKSGIDLIYLYLPNCPHCEELAPAFNAWTARLPPQVTVRRDVVVWSVPEKLTVHDPRVADAVLEALGGNDSAARQRQLADQASQRGWDRPDVDAFFARLGLSPAEAEKLAQSEATKAVLKRRAALVAATRATQVPYVIVARRSAVTVDWNGGDWQPERFVGVLEGLLAAEGVKMLPAAAPATAPPAVATNPVAPAAPGGTPAAATAYVPRPMPMPTDFLPVPANAAALPPRKCPSGHVRTQPKDIFAKDEVARRSMSQLRSWGAKNFRFDGPPGCTDYDFVISQWQAMVGLPQTGVLDAAVVKSVQAEIAKIAPQARAAHEEWSKARVAARAAGLDPMTGRPLTAEQRAQYERFDARREGRDPSMPSAAGPPRFQRPAPVGPMEKQVFGFSLGQPFAPQLPLCEWRSGWAGGLDFKQTCQHRMKRLGASNTNWLTPFEAEIFTETVSSAAEVAPEQDGLVAISFADDERPGLLARAGIRGLLVEGRLEGIGFVPSDRDAVLEAFTSRFGPPVPMPVSMQNESGATWTGRRYEFRRGDVTAMLNCVGFGTNSCSFAEVLTTRGRSALDEWRRRDARRGVQF